MSALELYVVRREGRTWAVVEAGNVAAVVEGGFFSREAADKSAREWNEDAAADDGDRAPLWDVVRKGPHRQG